MRYPRAAVGAVVPGLRQRRCRIYHAEPWQVAIQLANADENLQGRIPEPRYPGSTALLLSVCLAQLRILFPRLQLSIASLQTSPEKVHNRTIGVSVTFSQKSDVKKHLAQGFKKTHYLTPTNLNTPAENGNQESAMATDSTVARLDDQETVLVKKLP
jgi:hypothetical protein